MKKLIALSIALILLITSAAPFAYAFTYPSGLEDFTVTPTNNANYTQALAHPQTYENKTLERKYYISYDDSLAVVSFDLNFTVAPGYVGLGSEISYDIEWEIRNKATDVKVDSGIINNENNATVKASTNKLDKTGVYEAKARIFIAGAQMEWLPFEIEVVRTHYEPQTQELLVYKTDDKNAPLAGATLRMEGETYEGEGLVYDEKSNNEGEVVFEVEYGEYELTEYKAPDGYIKSEDSYTIVVTANGVYIVEDEEWIPYEPVTFVNKKDEVVSNPSPSPTVSPGASPSASPGGQPSASPSTGPAPSQSATPAPSTSPPPSTGPAPSPSTGASAGATIKVNKTDEDGKPLAGARLRMTNGAAAGGQSYDAVSGADGTAEFSVANGEYTLSEYAAPEGYNATDATYKISVAAGAASIVGASGERAPYAPVTFVNKKIPELNKDDHFAYMQGYPDGTFGPDLNMTRAEAVVMFSRLLTESMDLDAEFKESFYPDTPAGEWYFKQVSYMHQLGVLADYCRDSRFRPDEPVTRAEFATLAAHFDNLTLTDANKFTDVADNHWAVKYINSAAAKGWILGYPDNTFKPEANITRAEVVTLVNRILERYADEAYVTANRASLPRNYLDTEPIDWSFLAIMEASIGHDYTKAGLAETWTSVYK